MTRGDADRLLARVWSELGRDAAELDRLAPLPTAPLPARLDVSGLAVASVAAASLAAWAASAGPGSIRLDGDRIANAFRSERVARFDGEAPDVWSPLSGFRRTRDGWVRTHGNYPHHASALRRVLGLSATDAAVPALVDDAVSQWSADALASEVTAAGGMCVVVAPEDPAVDDRLAGRPLIDVARLADAAPPRSAPRIPDRALPLAGIRVLDLTRVIAGPVATRTLALLGADVLRVDPPQPAEIGWQHLEGGPGKRTALVDARTPDGARTLHGLLTDAHVVVLGYRPASLARIGLDPMGLAARYPGLVIGQLSAWGFDESSAGRGGFDSLVQAASGIAMVEGEVGAPGVLSAQALDHATGYFLAAAVCTMVDRRAAGGGSWLGRMSLRRTAAELLRLPRAVDPTPARALDDAIAASHTTDLTGPAGRQRIALPAIASPTGAMVWHEPPRPWGSDAPRWAE